MNIDKNTKDKKQELLAYFRDRASEFLTDVKTMFADTQSIKGKCNKQNVEPD